MASLKTTITEQGLALMNTVIAGSGQLTFTSMAVGDGENLNTSALATDLVNKRIEVEVSKVYASEDGTVVCGNVENSTVEESFEIREVGVYAKQAGSEDAPILFSYTECEGIGGIPAADIVSINNEMLITIVTGNAEVIYIDNPNATATRLDITELTTRVDNLTQHVDEDYFTKDNIRGGLQTQTILGWDAWKNEATKNAIYLSGAGISVVSEGANILFPIKAGTLALLSDIPNVSGIAENTNAIATEVTRAKAAEEANATAIKTKISLLETVPATGTENANCYGYVGTLRNLGAFGGSVSVESLSVFTRTGATVNTDVALWCRILKVVDGAWVIAAQSETSRKWNEVSVGSELSFRMKAIAGVVPPSADDKIAIVWVNDASAETTACNGMLGFRVNTSIAGGITSQITSDPSTSEGQSYSPVLKLHFAPMSGEEEVATKEELDALSSRVEELGTGGSSGDVDLSGYLPLTGGEITGTLSVPTAAEGTNDTTAASTEFVNTAIDNALANIDTSSSGTIDSRSPVSLSVTEEYDETSGYTYTSQYAVPTASGYLSCQATQTNASGETNKIILTCSLIVDELDPATGTVSKVLYPIHKDCAYGYGDMASLLIPVKLQTPVVVQATSSEPVTMEVKFMRLL